MKRLAILGASGHGKVLADIAELLGYDEISFFDDAWPEKQYIGVWNILGDTACLLEIIESFDACIIGIGNNSIRQQKQTLLEKHHAPMVSLIHPTAVVSRYAKVARGSVIMANATVNPFAKLSAGCIVNTAATIDHDCTIGEYSHISPGVHIAGTVTISDRCWIGIGASIKQCLSVGQSAIVGAGAVVVHNVPDNITVVGCPAKPFIDKDH